ncbi:transcription-repair coupling factor [Salisediminibacterium halotolerans]|uniref:Transcription-repair-coupling factor n=1 Tax=Salisediminibacterium halotolerans TaxID=517425 RepID=A0A1H9VS88_9BACI|nr:transcription-repair coupling factor [Salisediminibacterium haloalkalitolerans]SES24411.1 transcription-repair coupling factor (superfamily II helicase) [Salisediminibacterium haloalkalitolerans]
MQGLIQTVMQTEDVNQLAGGIESGLSEQMVAGVSGSARSLIMAALYKRSGRSQLIVTHNLFQAQKLYDDLVSLLGDANVWLYPANELISAEIAVASPEMRGQRLEVLNHWAAGKEGIVIAPVAGVRRLLPPPAVWGRQQTTLTVGEDEPYNTMLEKFVAMGYHRADMVSAPGEFSVRGGIVDIYPLTETHPLRIELFDTEVDSIRYFDVDTQRSLETVPSVTVGPAKELMLEAEHFTNGAGALEKCLAETLRNLTDESVKEQTAEKIGEEVEWLKNRTPFDAMYKYMSLYYDRLYTLLDYLPAGGTVFIDEVSRVQETAASLENEEAEWLSGMASQGAAVPQINVSRPFEDVIAETKAPLVYYSLFLRSHQAIDPKNIVNIQTKSMQQFHGQINLLKSEVERWKEADYGIVFTCNGSERAQRLKRVLEDYGIEAAFASQEDAPKRGEALIMEGHLVNGFELSLQRTVVVTEEDVFTKQTRKPKRRQKLSNAERIKNYSELKVGDWVVHVNHGIGKYLGIETLQVGDTHQDYLHISYKGNDKLYVPVDQIDQVQKYVASDDKDPKLYALGGSDWKKVKNKVENSVQDIADDLIKLYAERQQTPGYAFSEDDAEQREFEASFPYQETEDQLQAIDEIKKDMQRDFPMDRLLCGDVGYGKTEVALRAAFKAIMDGKQVAILVPTTILAQQHYETIRERFQEFPVNTGMMSRFRSRKEQKQTADGLAKGTVDIVVGTHRMLSKDTSFKDLGLLVVDEEQRFGVTHKEKIKQLKANVDVLTLTATPIPRTLHMSMLGVRDLSVIETPPENRFPVQTYVIEYNDAFIREAIEREMARGGQVFFLYNRVDDIESVAERMNMLVPEANVAYAHGRMSENELEPVMLDFLEGTTDVLVTTTIIETGVDIPNVNTLIINDADKMGLSQLYQLRGRVGRSNRVAYAYFTHQRDKVLTEVAERRLQSIKEFTELGSGFKIAMRDLSIRGAGNLLGAEQHGFIASVGFDLYSQMLKEAIEERKDEAGIEGDEDSSPKQEEKPDIELDIQVDAYIPQSYIADSKQKIDMYKRFKAIQSFEDISDLQNELIDRFGEYPPEVAHLFAVTKVKLYARKEGVETISEKKNECKAVLTEEATNRIDGSKLFTLVNKLSNKLHLSMEGSRIAVHLKTKSLSDREYLSILESVLGKLPEVQKDTAKA